LESPALDAEAKMAFLNYSVAGKSLTEEDWKKAGSKSKPVKKEKSDAGQPDENSAKKTKGSDLGEFRDRAYRDALCSAFFDVRYFGQVVSTEGPLKGSFYGQIRGPLQITFAESLDKILQLDFSITRCAVANEAEAEKKGDDNRTMGRKHAVPYGLYRCHIHFSPAFAAKTGFTYGDLDNFLFALTRMMGDYGVDGSSARPGGMRVVGLVDFQHSTALGNAPAHKLFSLVEVKRVTKSDGELSDFPRDLNDYDGTAPDGDIYTIINPYGLVTGCTSTKPAPKDGNQPQAAITARRLIWDIPSTDPTGTM
jgi:CRISPR-associated protein Csd2